MFLAALALLVAAQSPEEYDDRGYYGGIDLHLVCYGEGARPQAQTVPTLHWNRRHKEFGTDYATVMSRKEFDAMVQIDIHGDSGHIYLPKKLVPPIHTASDNGWWEITELQVGPREIRGRYRLNGLNKPKIRIDRMTGHASIEGQSGFSGTCTEDHGGTSRRF